MANIREKIKKLLALGASPNENEAKAAMLKAKELMIKNKLTEADFEEEQAKITKMLCKDITWTTDSGRVWMAQLCTVIADNYCCVAAWDHTKGTRTYTLVITGMGSDVEVCNEVIEYALGFVIGTAKALSRKPGYRSDLKSVERSYAMGFIMGLEMAFEEQRNDHPEWALVEVKSKEVEDYENSLDNRSVRSKESSMDMAAYMKGQIDGSKFNTKKVIA